MAVLLIAVEELRSAPQHDTDGPKCGVQIAVANELHCWTGGKLGCDCPIVDSNTLCASETRSVKHAVDIERAV